MSSSLDVTADGERIRLMAEGLELTLRPTSGALHVHGAAATAPESGVARAAAQWIARRAQERGERVWVSEKEAGGWLRTGLLDAGLRVHREKVLVRRSLTDLPPSAPVFAWRPLAACGHEELLAVLVAVSEGDPFEDEPRDHEREYADLLEGAGEALDPQLWRLASCGTRTVGVVLPLRYADQPDLGTLYYVGIVPEERGRGLGRALHAAGLQLLAEAGCERYLGSTDVRNAAMMRCFEANGCRAVAREVWLQPPGDRG